MPSNGSCPNRNFEFADPRFKELMEHYKKMDYSEGHILTALQAYREYKGYGEDWYPDPTKPQDKSALTRFMTNRLPGIRISQTTSEADADTIYNLYTTLYSLYTPEQLDNRINMIKRNFQDIVDRIEEKAGRGFSRYELIRLQGDKNNNGFKKIMDIVKRQYENVFANPEARMAIFDKNHPNATEEEREKAKTAYEYSAPAYKTVLENWNRLVALAAPKIGEDEGFVVNVRNFEIDLDIVEDDNLDDPNSTPDGENGEDNEEGSKGDRYGDFRTLKLMNTLSTKARKLISNIPRLNAQGRIVRDDIGNKQYISGRQVAVVLKRALVNSTPESMMQDLENAKDYYPWLSGLIDVLNKDKNARTTIYANFKNAESTYVYVELKDGKYTPHISNTRSAGNALMREAGINLRSGFVVNPNTSIYTDVGALKSADTIKKIQADFQDIKKRVMADEGLKWISTVNKDHNRVDRIRDIVSEGNRNGKDYSYLLDGSEQAIKGFLKANPDISNKIAGFLQGMGFVVSGNDIETIASQSMSAKSFLYISGTTARENASNYGRNKLYQLLKIMDSLYSRAIEIHKQGQVPTGGYLYNTTDELRRINNCIALSQYKELESRVVSEGKSLSTYNNVNLLHQTFDELLNKEGLEEAAYQSRIENNFLRYEGMSLGYGNDRQVFGWLQKFRDNEDGIREKLRVVDVSAFNHVEYSNLSRSQKLTNSMVMFFQSGKTFQDDDYAAYEVPIQADYSTAYDFIVAPRIKVNLFTENSEIVEALTNELQIELERIVAIQRRIKDDSRIKLDVYEEQGQKIQIFPELNTPEFFEGYKKTVDQDEVRSYLRNAVFEQLQKVVAKDIKTIEDAGVLKNKNLSSVDLGYSNYGSLYTESGRFSDLSSNAQSAMREYFLNVFYARQQIVKIITGGTEQFNGLIDFEKRNMLSHATRTSLYTKATWNGEEVGRDTQNVVYIEDDESASAFLDDIKGMLHQLLDDKIISEAQYKSMVKSYSKIKTTDGQGLRTLDSYRRIMIMSDAWDERHESAYQRIKTGNPTKDDIEVFMQNIKPVYTGYEPIKASSVGDQKPVKLTVLHKYSEAVLLPMELYRSCLQNKAVPFQALDLAQKALAKDKEIDMFLFHSGVKVGGHSIIQPFAKDKQTKDRLLKSASSIKNFIVGEIGRKPAIVHTLPLKYYGIAASTPAHAADDKIAWAAQAEKVAWANIAKPKAGQDSQKIVVRGKEEDAWDMREKYFAIKTADIVEAYTELRDLFMNTDELERIFQEELATKSYSSRELQYALSHLKNGTFALPLYSPNVEHQVQELLSSIIKKRLTKPRVKGANILQSTGLGMDAEVSSFDNNHALSEDDKLKIVFEGEGKNRHIKYVEVFMPLFDSRLKQFADEYGNISPKNLQSLIDNHIIPEDILKFVAYRTPSDAEHSVIPCRIKGFIANVAGATIRMPKEVMVMTGHDYDGDKMRCHFADFHVSWNRRLINELYNDRLSELNPGEEIPYQLKNADNFFHWFVSDKNETYDKQYYRKIVYEPYDYNLSPSENSRTARNNARVELMFAQLTSPDGSKRVLIPGGCDETKVIAKTLSLVRAAGEQDRRQESELTNDEIERIREQKETRRKIADKIIEQEVDKVIDANPGMSKEDAIKKVDTSEIRSSVEKTNSLYNMLIRRSDGELTDILRVVSGLESPFSLTHSADSYDYIMGGAELISVYALYNSAFQMMQRLDMSYIPKLSKNGNRYDITLFGNNWSSPEKRLFEINNHRGRLASLGLARLLNAAVDNNKDPVLGYLNQTREMAEMTFLMLAMGQTEEEIHLIMNQPAVIKLIERLKDRNNAGLVKEARGIIEYLYGGKASLAEVADPEIGPWNALDTVSKMSREDFVSSLSKSYNDISGSTDLGFVQNQIAVLQLLVHLNGAANQLGKFVRLTRPESESGAIGTSIADITTKIIALNDFRQEIELGSENGDLRFTGMRDILAPRDVKEGMNTSYFEDIIGETLPEIVALNSLMIDSSPQMLWNYFPQARTSWMNTAGNIAKNYKYKSIQEGTVKKIMEEMILWKLLKDERFISENPNEEQKRIVNDVPAYLKTLIERVDYAKTHPENNDPVKNLVGNAFLENLEVFRPETSSETARIRFVLNGPPVEGTSDLIRSSWGELLKNDTVIATYKDSIGAEHDVSVRDLAIDLFKYNLYTNGFSYGMYEFAHFAPFSVILQTPGYVNALQGILKSDWNDSKEIESFTHQYYMNHWGDSKFLTKYKSSELKYVNAPAGITNQLWISKNTSPEIIQAIQKSLYIVVERGDDGKAQELYRVEPGNGEAEIVLIKAQKLGVRNRSGQAILHYEPFAQDFRLVSPIVVGNDSAWGELDDFNPYAEANYEDPGVQDIPEGQARSVDEWLQKYGDRFDAFGDEKRQKQIEKVESEAEKAVKKNDSRQGISGKDGDKIVRHRGFYDRNEVRDDRDSLYIFTDNTDRDSGSGLIAEDSWYSKKYGIGHHFPTMTSAVIRGLDNARPISTQRWYHYGAKGETGRWNDSDFTEFRKVIDDEFAEIASAWRTGQYKRIVFPSGKDNTPGDGLFNSKIAAITRQRTPILYDYLQQKVRELTQIVNGEEVTPIKVPEAPKVEKTAPVEMRQTSVVKIISGGQTGVDTIGLQVGRKLGIETGGTAPKNFLRESGIDTENIASYGLTEITDEEQSDYTKRTGKKDPYTARTELNVRNSDGTVYFSSEADSAGLVATRRAANQFEKPFILNPTARQLNDWLVANDIKVLNVAGNRGSKLSSDNKVAQVLELALNTKREEAPIAREQTSEGFDPSMFQGFDPLLGGLTGDVDLSDAEFNFDEADEGGKMFNIVRRDENGNIISENLPATPYVISQARKQKVFVSLNQKLREILRQKGIGVGVLTRAEARMSLGGVTDFDTAIITAEGLREMIRISNGYEGEQALPEEFAHVALDMLGHDHPLVSRLVGLLRNNSDAMKEAYGDMYEEYVSRYGKDNIDKLALEAAGKLVAKQLFYHEEIQTKPARSLIGRIIDAIKDFFKKTFTGDEIQNAIFEANEISSKIAREMLGGKLIDEMAIENISSTGVFQSAKKRVEKVKTDLSGKHDILSKLLKNEVKKLSIYEKRLGYAKKEDIEKNYGVKATKNEIAKLELAIKNNKTEEAVIAYMNDAMQFLSEMEKSLDDKINGGARVNAICRRLNAVRDTLYSVAAAVQDVREAIMDKEIQDTAGLTDTLGKVSEAMERFFVKYNTIARTYFEEMLSSVYGEHGKTVEIGRDKGRVITIKEMARRADRDITLASRWFNSLADCNDYVLKAIDDIVRDAKIRARKRSAEVRPKIEVAIRELIDATGSRDQSFMFEMKRYDGEKWCNGRTDDGKLHKTGEYISEAASQNLSPAQKKFYDTIMAIKRDADNCLPEQLVRKPNAKSEGDSRKIVMMRKYTMDRFMDAEGAKGKALEAWEGLKNRVMDTSDNVDYDNQDIAKDFEGNRVDKLPVKFLMKGKNESFDDMTDDVATSMMAYAGMAHEYSEMNGIIGIIENAKYMASQRDVVQKTGTRTQRESITTDNYEYREPFTVKQARTKAQEVLEDFFQMHVYGHVRAEEGTIGRTRISKRKLVDTTNTVVSYSQMAMNLPQRIANISTGLTQIVIESAGKGVFNAKDVAWASAIYTKEGAGRLAETGKTDFHNKLSLWDEYFDVHQDNGRSNDKYGKGRMSRVFNSNLLYSGLQLGEDYLATVTSLATAKNFKVKNPEGKIETLWDAYEVKYLDEEKKSGAYLALKHGYTKEDGSPITAKDEKKFSKQVIGLNFDLQGIYNLDDRSAVQQYAFGALIIMYRKWIAPALKRRYARAQYSTLKGQYEEGYYVTTGRFLWDTLRDAKDQVTEEEGASALFNIINDAKAIISSWRINKSKLTDYEKSNLSRAFTELSIVASLWAATALFTKLPPPGEDDDYKLTWFDQTLLSQMLRLRTEIGSQAPTPLFVDEALKILKSPFAAIGPIQDALNIFQLFVPSNYFTEIKHGRYAGHSKSYKYFRELPVISMFKKIDNFLDPSPLINYYKNGPEY